MSQTNALNLGGSREVKTGLNSIGTRSWKYARFLNGVNLNEFFTMTTLLIEMGVSTFVRVRICMGSWQRNVCGIK